MLRSRQGWHQLPRDRTPENAVRHPRNSGRTDKGFRDEDDRNRASEWLDVRVCAFHRGRAGSRLPDASQSRSTSGCSGCCPEITCSRGSNFGNGVAHSIPDFVTWLLSEKAVLTNLCKRQYAVCRRSIPDQLIGARIVGHATHAYPQLEARSQIDPHLLNLFNLRANVRLNPLQ